MYPRSLPTRIGPRVRGTILHLLPDGVGTNGVVAEVPPFPVMNFQWKIQTCEHMATCGNTCALKANSDKSLRGGVRPLL